ncbi:MAG: hypothetical protein IK152_06705 [Lachnospiraceae bacterium]|nr:hypothetical protein [Lachnospiraceae bacterium]
MKWAKKLIYGEEAGKKRIGYVTKLKMGKGVLGLSAIVISPDSPNQFDIIDTKLLMWKRYPKDDLIIVGIAKGQDEALDLMEHFSQKVYDETGTLDMKNYVLEHGVR